MGDILPYQSSWNKGKLEKPTNEPVCVEICVYAYTYNVYPDIYNSNPVLQGSPLAFYILCFYLYAVFTPSTKHSTARAVVSLRGMLVTVPTDSSRVLTQRFCLWEEQTVKQMAPNLS